jgi:hypothetical protein
MQVNNLLYCDLCTTYIPAGEKNRVNYGNQDFHFILSVRVNRSPSLGTLW